jgi:hypothetical protein
VIALPKGCVLKQMGIEKPQSSPYQSAATFLAKITEQSIGASRVCLSLSR